MKDKQVACVILILIMAVMGWGTQKMYNAMNGKKQEAESSMLSAESARTQFDMASITLERLRSDSKPLHAFHAAWDPYLQSTKSPQATEQRVVDLLKDNEVFAVSQRFQLIKSKDSKSIFEGILRADIKIEDEFSKVFNWLAALEESMPTSRVHMARLVRGASGDDVVLELVVDFPILSSKA